MTLALSAKITADASGFVAGVKAAQGALGGLDRAAAGSGAAAAAMADGASAAAKSARAWQEEANNSALAMADAASAAGLLAAAVSALGVVDLIRRVAETSAEFQKLNGMLVTATGSTAAAASAFRLLKSFAAETPFDLAQVTEAFIKLKNLGLDASIASMRAYGDFASAMGKPMMQMIEAAADAATGEFERLKEFGIRAETEGAKIRFTFRGVETEVANSAGSISGYLTDLGRVQFAGEMDRQAKTLGGAFNNLGDAVQNALNTVGQGGVAAELQVITEALGVAAAGGESAASALGSVLADGLAAGRAAAGLLADNLHTVAGAAAGMATMAGGTALLGGLAAMRAAVMAAGGAVAYLNAMLLANPIGVAALGIGTLVAAYVEHRTAAALAAQAEREHITTLAQLDDVTRRGAGGIKNLSGIKREAAEASLKVLQKLSTAQLEAAETEIKAIEARIAWRQKLAGLRILPDPIELAYRAVTGGREMPSFAAANRAADEAALKEQARWADELRAGLAGLRTVMAAVTPAGDSAADSAANLSKQFRAAADAAGVAATKQGLVAKATNEVEGHLSTLNRVLAMSPAKMAELGTSAMDVAQIMDNLRRSVDPVAQAVEAMNKQIALARAADGAERSALADLQKMNDERKRLGEAPLSTVSHQYLTLLTKAKELETARVAGAMKSEAIIDLEKRIATARAAGNQAAALRLEKEKDVAEMVAKGVDPVTAAAKANQEYETAIIGVTAAGADWEKGQNLAILAAERLARAQLLGADAVREAEIVNRAASEADKERVALDSARGQAILAKVRAEEKWKRVANDNAALRGARADLADLKAEVALHGQSAAVRERAVRSIHIQRQAVEQFGSATSDAARQWIALQEQIADAEAVKKFHEEVNRVAEDIAGDLATAMFEGFAGSETDILDWFKGLLKRMAIEIVKQQFVLPITTSVVSAVPGLFGIAGPTTGAQAAAGGGQAGGGLGGVGNWLGLGSKFMPSSWTSGITGAIDTWGATTLGIGSAATMPATVLTGANGMLAGGGATSVLPGQVAAGTGLTSYLGPLGIGATVGGFLGPMAANGNKAVGGLVGAAGGAAAGALAGTFLFPGVGTLVGALIGGAGGGIGGLLGTSKPEYPAVAATAGYSGGRVSQRSATTDNRGDKGAADALADRLAGALAGFFAAAGAVENYQAVVGVEEKQGKYKYLRGGNQYGSYGSADEAAIAGLRREYQEGAFALPDANVQRAFDRSSATTLEDFGADIAVAKSFDATMARWRDGVSASSQALDDMRAAADDLGESVKTQVVDWRDRVVGLDLAADADLTAPLQRAIEAMAGLSAAEEPLVGAAAAAAAVQLNFAALQPAMAAVGMTADAQADILTKMQIKARGDWDAAVGLARRQADVALRQAGGDAGARLSYADTLRAAGFDPARAGLQALADTLDDVAAAADAGATSGAAYVAARAQMDALLDAGRVTGERYAEMIDLLAAEMRRGAEAAQAAAQAQAEAAAALSDLRVRALSASGLGDIGARLTQDLAQARELADWTAAGRDAGLLGLLHGVDDAALAAEQDHARVIAAYQRDEQALQAAISARQEEVAAITATQSALRAMAQGAQDARDRIWTDERLSSLGSTARADRADTLLREYFSKANDSSLSADERSLAYQRFQGLIDAALTAKRAESGDWGAYDAYLREIDAMLGQLGAGGELTGAVTDVGDAQLDALQQQLSELQRAREAAERGTGQVVGSLADLSRIAAGSAATLAALQAQLAADARVTPGADDARAAVAATAAGRGSLWAALSEAGMSEAQALTSAAWSTSDAALTSGLSRVADTDWLNGQLSAASAAGWAPLAAAYATRLQDLTGRSDTQEAVSSANYEIEVVNREWERLTAAGLSPAAALTDPTYQALQARQGAAISRIDDVGALRALAAANDWTGEEDGTVVERQLAHRMMDLTRTAGRFSAGGIIAGGVAGRDSALALTMPDEAILNVSAARRIGHENVHALNAGAALVDMTPVSAGLEAVGARVTAAVAAGARQTVTALAAVERRVGEMAAEIADLRRENQRLAAALSRRAA